MSKRWTRLLPVMMLTYIIAFMDRTNIGFAIPVMGKELHFSPVVLGFASGVLFLGYGVSQAAGGWLADRGHGKALIAWLLVLWGVTELLQAVIRTPAELVAVRFMLGLFEGGIFPTMLLFVRNWFAPSERARANGLWQLSYPLAGMLSGPIAGLVLSHGSWQTLFIVEGIFPILWVLVWLWGVAESPAKAHWLTPAQREAILAKLHTAEPGPPAARPREEPAATVRAELGRRAVQLYCAAVFFWNIGFVGFVIWLPSVLHQDKSLSQAEVGWLAAIPFAAAMVMMPILTARADHTLNRRFYAGMPILLSGLCLAVAGLTYAGNGLVANMLLITTAGALLYGSQPVLWSMPADIVSGRVLGAVMGVMNGIGVLGAFVGPYLVGYVRGMAGSFATGLVAMGGCLALSSLLLGMVRKAPGGGMVRTSTEGRVRFVKP
jgi:sugar phosphate permease